MSELWKRRNLNWFMRKGPLRLLAQFFPTKVIGRENIPLDEAFVCIAVPHKSYTETFIVPVKLGNVEFHIMAKASLFKIPVFGPIFTKADGIPVDRAEGMGGPSFRRAVQSAKAGYVPLNFPEATRYLMDDNIHRVKIGPIRIAEEAGVKIVMLVLANMRKGSKGRRTITVLPPIDPAIALQELEQALGRPLDAEEGRRLLMDKLMYDAAAVLGVEYVGNDERGVRV